MQRTVRFFEDVPLVENMSARENALLKSLITCFFVPGDSFVVNACLTKKGIDDWLVKQKYYCSRLERRDCHHRNNCALTARVSTTPLCTRIKFARALIVSCVLVRVQTFTSSLLVRTCPRFLLLNRLINTFSNTACLFIRCILDLNPLGYWNCELAFVAIAGGHNATKTVGFLKVEIIEQVESISL